MLATSLKVDCKGDQWNQGNIFTFGDADNLPDLGNVWEWILVVESLSSEIDLLLSIGRDTSLPVSKEVIERLSELALFFDTMPGTKTVIIMLCVNKSKFG